MYVAFKMQQIPFKQGTNTEKSNSYISLDPSSRM